VLSRISATDVAIADDEYDSIYLVVMPSLGSARLFKLSYGPGSPAGGASRK
jgi:hypothetical protein